MTRKELNQIMALVKVNWPSAFKGASDGEKKLLFSSWYITLRDLSASTVTLAILQLVSSSKWPPTVAEIREKVKSLYYQAEGIIMFDRSWRDMFPNETSNDAKLLAARQITADTSHLRGDRPPEMTLDQFLSSPEFLNITSGEVEKYDRLLIERGAQNAEAD